MMFRGNYIATNICLRQWSRRHLGPSGPRLHKLGWKLSAKNLKKFNKSLIDGLSFLFKHLYLYYTPSFEQ